MAFPSFACATTIVWINPNICYTSNQAQATIHPPDPALIWIGILFTSKRARAFQTTLTRRRARRASRNVLESVGKTNLLSTPKMMQRFGTKQKRTQKETRLTFISVRNWKHPVSPNGSNRDFPAFHFAPFVCCPFLGTAQQEGTEGDGIFKEEKEVKDCFDSARIRCGTPAGVAWGEMESIRRVRNTLKRKTC